jgi:hypothetical protein
LLLESNCQSTVASRQLPVAPLPVDKPVSGRASERSGE